MLFSPHVHFPSTPGLTFTGDTYSPGTYDRACIAVSPNSCAMPERGGRVYSPSSMRPRPINSYFHPRAFEACQPEATAVPALLPDLSSETDESAEECVSPKSSSPEPRVAVRMHGTPYHTLMPIRRTHSQEEFDHALSFLPHPPVPVPNGTFGKRRNAHRPRRSVMFTELVADDCDGCLGGF